MDRARELISFTKHLYYLTKMGAPLTETLEKIKGNISDRRFRKAVEDVEEQMEAGETLSGAMAFHPRQFPADYVKMIEAAEESETLTGVLEKVASYLEAVEVARKNIQTAAFYPGLILNFSFLFVIAVYYFCSNALFTQYSDFIMELGKRVSPVTLFFIGAAKFIFSPVFIVILAVVVLTVDLLIFTRASMLDSFLLKLPFVSDIFRKSYTSRISRTMGFMMKQGLTAQEALNIASKTAESTAVKGVLGNISEYVKQGDKLSSAMKKTDFFSNTFIFMIQNGERNENLPDALIEAAEFIEDDLEGIYKRTLRFIEPVFIAMVGCVVGFMTVCIFLPFYNLTGAIN